MLIRITNRCRMGCRHCAVDASGPEGEHMSMGTFRSALDLTCRLGLHCVILSGGEPFEHPRLFDFLGIIKAMNRLCDAQFLPIITSNGMFLEDDKLFERFAAEKLDLPVQITNDSRYYSRPLRAPPERLRHPKVFLEEHIRLIAPCRRVREAGIPVTKTAPDCYNLRVTTRKFGLVDALVGLEQGRFTRTPRRCTPSINVDGTIVAGEFDTCQRLGTVDSSPRDIEQALVQGHCNKCGLVYNLGIDLRRQIGWEMG